MSGTLIRDENLDALASKQDVQELAASILKIEQVMVGEKTNSKKVNTFVGILKFIWKILPIVHLVLHMGTIGLLLGFL